MNRPIPAIDFRPDELAREVELSLAPALLARGGSFELSLGAGCERPRRGDPFRLRELIDSLLLPMLDRPETTVQMELACNPQGLELRIKGAPPNARCVELAALLGARLTPLPSGLGDGLQLELAMPEASGEAGAESSSGALAGMRLLIADDSRTNLLVLRDMLRASGARMVLVADGEQALEAWSREKFDLLLLDIGMPVLDGLEALRRIRALEIEHNLPQTPAIAVTANAGADQVAEYILAGFDDHLAKPFRRRELIDTVAAMRFLG